MHTGDDGKLPSPTSVRGMINLAEKYKPYTKSSRPASGAPSQCSLGGQPLLVIRMVNDTRTLSVPTHCCCLEKVLRKGPPRAEPQSSNLRATEIQAYT